jgi:ParB family chromosome partitioning protein
MPKTHRIKIWPEFYNAICRGAKKFELRINDRDYKEGQYLELQEFEPAQDMYTGRKLTVRILDMITSYQCAGLQDGYVCMSISDYWSRKGD